MGEVYRALDTNLARNVAIKILPDLVARDPERLARFEREARTLAALNHPHIAQIYGFEKADGVPAIVLELVEGSSETRATLYVEPFPPTGVKHQISALDAHFPVWNGNNELLWVDPTRASSDGRVGFVGAPVTTQPRFELARDWRTSNETSTSLLEASGERGPTTSCRMVNGSWDSQTKER